MLLKNIYFQQFFLLIFFADYSDEEDEVSDHEEVEPRTVKERYTELRSTYSKTLTPDGDSLSQPINYEDDYEEEIEEEISEEEDEDDEDDEDIEEDENDDYEDEENEELLKRLDAKYGKLPGSDVAAKSNCFVHT